MPPPMARIETRLEVGTGVLFHSKRLLTAAHVVAGCDEAQVYFPGVGRSLRAKVDWRGPWREEGDHGDVAILELDVAEAPGGIRPCRFADVHALRPHAGRPEFKVRTFGYPDKVGSQGIYTYGTTSEALLLDGEWLQIDAISGQFPIERGMSGAPCWFEDTDEVVGITTDSLPRYDYRIARMLPLDTIRRYWEELDEYLPAGTPTRRFKRDELRRILTDAATSSPPQEILRTSLPFFYDMIQAGTGGAPLYFGSAWQAARRVEEEAESPNDLHCFFRALEAGLVDADRRRRLAGWIEKWLPALPAGLAAQSQISAIVVRADHTRESQASYAVSMTAVVNGVPGRPLGPFEVTREELRGKVQEELPRLVGSFHGDADWAVEFNVPPDLMSEPYDEWEYRDAGVSDDEPLRSSPLIVRDVNRGRRGKAPGHAKNRWNALLEQNDVRIKDISCKDDYTRKAFRNMLDAARRVGALAFEAIPRDDWLTAALEQGVPIMLWRRDACAVAEPHGPHGDFLTRLVDHLDHIAPERVPEEVAALRIQAWAPEHEEDDMHLGRRLTLFWDHPYRACVLDEPPYAMGEGDG